MRPDIRAEIAAIPAWDDQEAAHQSAALAWIDSGAELCRLAKPATPPKHLVSYCVGVDGDHVLLGAHLLSGLWLPCGGHVEPGEHPVHTARRELGEEIGVTWPLMHPRATFITQTHTQGPTAPHEDVSLWYVFRGDRGAALHPDPAEFSAMHWFARADIPYGRTDPNMRRFLDKLFA